MILKLNNTNNKFSNFKYSRWSPQDTSSHYLKTPLPITVSSSRDGGITDLNEHEP